MTVTLTTSLDASGFVDTASAMAEALGIDLDPWQSGLLERALAPLSGVNDARIRRSQIAATSAISTSLARLRDELEHANEDLYDHMEALDADLAAYMWAHLTLGLTEAAVLAHCSGILHGYARVVAYLPNRPDLIADARRDAESLALAALQGWSDRLARTAATR